MPIQSLWLQMTSTQERHVQIHSSLSYFYQSPPSKPAATWNGYAGTGGSLVIRHSFVTPTHIRRTSFLPRATGRARERVCAPNRVWTRLCGVARTRTRPRDIAGCLISACPRCFLDRPSLFPTVQFKSGPRSLWSIGLWTKVVEAPICY